MAAAIKEFTFNILTNQNDAKILQSIKKVLLEIDKLLIEELQIKTMISTLIRYRKVNVLTAVFKNKKINQSSYFKSMISEIFCLAILKENSELFDTIEHYLQKNITPLATHIIKDMNTELEINDLNKIERIIKLNPSFLSESVDIATIPNIEIYNLYKWYGFQPELAQLLEDGEQIQNIKDEVLSAILLEETLNSHELEEDQIEGLVIQLLLFDKIQSLSFLLTAYEAVVKEALNKAIYDEHIALSQASLSFLMKWFPDLKKSYDLKTALENLQTTVMEGSDKYMFDLDDINESKIDLIEGLIDKGITAEDVRFLNPTFATLLLSSLAYINSPKLSALLFEAYKDDIQGSLLNTNLIVLSVKGVAAYENIIKLFPKGAPEIKKLTLEMIKGLYIPALDIILKYHGDELASDPDIVRAVNQTLMPGIYNSFIKYNIATNTAQATKMQEIEEIQNRVPRHNKIATDKDEVLQSLYGKNITQNQFKDHIEDLSALVCYELKHGKFILSVPQAKITDNEPIDVSSFSFFSEKKSKQASIDLSYIASFRQKIAKLSGDTDHHNFGAFRHSDLSTPHTFQFASYIKEFLETFNDQLKYQSAGEFVGVDYQIYVDINGKKIPLTAYTIAAPTGSIWLHTRAPYIYPVLEHLDKLISTLIAASYDSTNSNDRIKIIEATAKIHWWLAHACPFERGSASIAEIIVKGIMKHHNMNVSWDCFPDCKALIEPDVEVYIKNYTKFSNVTDLPQPSIKQAPIMTRSLR